jgi:hypothetical protein
MAPRGGPTQAAVLLELRAVLDDLSPEALESTTQRQIFARVTDALGGASIEAHRKVMKAEIDKFLVVVGSQSEAAPSPAPAPSPAAAGAAGKRPRPAAWRRGAGATGCVNARSIALRCVPLRAPR